MKRLILTLLFSSMCLLSLAQQHSYTITGHVMDTDFNPWPFVDVILLSENKKQVTGTFTDDKGNFVLHCDSSGYYTLKFSFIGTIDVKVPLNCDRDANIRIDTVTMKDAPEALNEAVKIDSYVKSGTTTLYTSNSISSTTGSVLETLRNISSVTVDGNDNISVHGNSNVLILLDGVPTTLSSLSSLPVANVQLIEYSASPEAKYDAEGTGGVISISSHRITDYYTKDDYFGAMASANASTSGWYNADIAVNFIKGRWGLRINGGAKDETDLIESELHRQIRQDGSQLDQVVSATRKSANYNAGINLRYKASRNDFLTLDMKAVFPRMNNIQDFNNRYVSGGTTSEILRKTDITFNREMYEGQFGYRHVLPSKSELKLSAFVSSITGHRPSYYYEYGQMVQRSVSGGHPFNSSLQADYSIHARKSHFETGVKMTYRHNSIDHQMYELDPGSGQWEHSLPLSNDLRHSEYIPAAYASYRRNFDYLDLKAGLRAEYSYVTLQSTREKLDTHSDCFFLAPNVMLEIPLMNGWKVYSNLSRRITRPTYPQLNPYINLIDRQTYETGNIHLQPEKATKFSIGYSRHYIGRISLDGNAYYDHSSDYITQVSSISDGILTMTYINSDKDIRAGIDNNVKMRLTGWLEIDLATNTWHTCTEGTFEGADIRNSGWTNNSNVTFHIKPFSCMSVQAQYFLTTPQYFPQFTTGLIHFCNFGIKLTQPGRSGLSYTLLLNDAFNTRRWDIHSDNAVYSLVNKSKNSTRMLWFGMSWNINNYKTPKTKQKQENDRSIIRIGD